MPPAAPADGRAILRLIDANLDRAREGLRVVEDWCRFGLDRRDLVARCKDLRQRLGSRHADRYRLARDTGGDVAAGMAHPRQDDRADAHAIVTANCARVQEALRVLEEFARRLDPPLAAEAACCRYALYDLEIAVMQALPREPGHAGQAGEERRRRLGDCRLYLVSGPCPDLAGTVEAALRSGVRLVQYRSKDEEDAIRLREARRLRDLCAAHGALFLINDRVDLALAVDADGVHLGQQDLPVAVARRLLGPGRLIGRSTHGIAQLREAVRDGCDYVGAGPVHATPTKPGREPVGLDYVRAACAESPVPVFAIGGIDADNLAGVLAAGGQRVAVVRAITAAADPARASAALLRMLEEAPLPADPIAARS
jgi:thiamine-phosphate pyrophosphorylase